MKALNSLRFPPGSAPRAILALEAALVLGLAVQSARVIWTLASPELPTAAPMARTQSTVDLAILARFDAFGSGPAAGVESVGAPGLDSLRLHAVRVGGAGGGSAIIGTPDGVQKVYAVGQSVAGGAVLARVAEDHVELTRGGVSSRLSFPVPQ